MELDPGSVFRFGKPDSRLETEFPLVFASDLLTGRRQGLARSEGDCASSPSCTGEARAGDTLCSSGSIDKPVELPD